MTSTNSPSPPEQTAPREHWTARLRRLKTGIIAGMALAGIAAHLILRFAFQSSTAARDFPLLVILAAGGGPLVLGLLQKAWRRDFGSDLLAGISIVTSVLLGEYPCIGTPVNVQILKFTGEEIFKGLKIFKAMTDACNSRSQGPGRIKIGGNSGGLCRAVIRRLWSESAIGWSHESGAERAMEDLRRCSSSQKRTRSVDSSIVPEPKIATEPKYQWHFMNF